MKNEKKLIILYILQILEKYSDRDHYLTQKQIIEYLENEYGITAERKSISRYLAVLEEMDFGVCTTANGSYMQDRTFNDAELRMLIDGVLGSRYINENHSYDLIQKLSDLSSQYFKKRIRNLYAIKEFSKTDNQELFLNIEIIDEAIENNKQIECSYNKYGNDKQLHKSSTLQLSPYQFLLHNQRYYLMALNMKWNRMGYYRVDHMTDVKELAFPKKDIRQIAGFENGINYKDLSCSRPYMFADKAEKITFLTEEWMLDHVIDWFGHNIDIKPSGSKLEITLDASPEAVKYWAMQYGLFVEILKPESLRNAIKGNLQKSLSKYEK